MAVPKICGIETEYGILSRGVDINPMVASSLLVNAYSDRGLALRAWNFADESPDRDARDGWRPEADYPEVDVLMANSVLTNGSRFYVDHAHPEISTPECRTPSQVVLYDRAAEEIIRIALGRANERLAGRGELMLFKNNSDGKGNSYGCHENYLVDRATPFGRLASSITAHFVTRQIFCGAGKVGVESPREGELRVPFQISQRADFFEEPVGLETTVRRPIVNTRDEPHCDPARYRRLHVIVGDANMSETATFLKVGTTAILLSVIEDGLFPENLFVVDPVRQIRRVSHDCSMTAAIPCIDGTSRTAIEMQWTLLDAAKQWVGGVDDDTIGGESGLVLEAWSAILEGLERDPLGVSHLVDWIAKKRIIDSLAARDGLGSDHPRLRAVDLQYHDMRPGRSVAGKVGLRRMIEESSIGDAVENPPSDTRAFFRGECIRRWSDQVASANWDSIVFDTGDENLQRVAMADPLKGTRDHVGELLEAHPDLDGLLSAMDADTVENVALDPGW